MFSNWRFWPSALWKTLGSTAHQLVNFSFGPDPKLPEKITKLTTELGQATEKVQRLEPKNEELAAASQELARGLAQSMEILVGTEADLVQATKERDAAYAENEGLVEAHNELVDEMARVNTVLAQLEASYATKSRELKEVVAELKETAAGYDMLRQHILGFLSVYRKGWRDWHYRRKAISMLADTLEEVFEVTDKEYQDFKQANSETALARLQKFRQLLARLIRLKEKNPPQVEGGAA